MKKIFHTISLILMITACNSVRTEGETEITKGNDTVANLKVEVSNEGMNRKMNDNNLLFEGRGTEPGWFIQIYEGKLRLLVDYGADSVIIADSFEGIKAEENFNYNKVSGDNKLELNIKNKPCTDEGKGDTSPQTVVVNWKNKSYTGCGKFLN
jgi:uncharacterized membrane protein